MRKTSVYLSEETKAALHEVSVRWDRSEAELIRLAIDRLIRGAEQETAPSTAHRSDRPTGPRLFGVGVGPSAPDLITERAVRVLEQADQVFAASTAPDAIGRAEAILRTATPSVAVDRLPFAIAGDEDVRRRCVEDAAQTIVATLDQGKVVAFVTLGDPNVYSTFTAVARRVAALRPTVPIATVPGVMAFQELAASTSTVLAEGEEHVELVNMGGDPSVLDPMLLRRHATVVLYKGGRALPGVAERLAATSRLEHAVIGELMGLPGERSGPVSAAADRPASYLATVIIPADRRAAETADPTPLEPGAGVRSKEVGQAGSR